MQLRKKPLLEVIKPLEGVRIGAIPLQLIDASNEKYDSVLGRTSGDRYLSADPVLPDPSEMQAFNRYMYVTGNPLKYVDPTGNSGEGICHVTCPNTPPNINGLEEISVTGTSPRLIDSLPPPIEPSSPFINSTPIDRFGPQDFTRPGFFYQRNLNRALTAIQNSGVVHDIQQGVQDFIDLATSFFTEAPSEPGFLQVNIGLSAIMVFGDTRAGPGLVLGGGLVIDILNLDGDLYYITGDATGADLDLSLVLGFSLGGRFEGDSISSGVDVGAVSLDFGIDPSQNNTPTGFTIGVGPGGGISVVETTTTIWDVNILPGL